MWTHRLHSWLLFFSALWSPPVHRTPAAFAQRPMNVLEDDYGNRADNVSNLFFADYSGTRKYETPDDLAVTNQGFKAFYQMARSIAMSTFASEYPYDLLATVKEDPSNIPKILSGVSSRFKFCLALAVLLVTTYVVLAFSLPCSLCCSRCCRRRSRPAPTMLRVTSVGALVIILVGAFAMVGLAGTFVTLRDSKPARDQLQDNMVSALRDVKTYVELSTDELLFIFVKANFTKRVFDRDLDNIGSLMGQQMHDALMRQSGLGEAVRDLNQIEVSVRDSRRTLQELDAKLTQLADTLTSLSERTLDSATRTASCQSTNCNDPPPLSFTKPDYTAARTGLNTLSRTNLSNIISQSIRQVSSIPERTQRAARGQTTALKRNLQTQLDRVNEFQKVVRDVRDTILIVLKTDDYEKAVKEGFSSFGMLDDERVTAQYFLLMPELVAMVLMVIGVIVVGYLYWQTTEASAAVVKLPAFSNTACGEKVIYAGIGIFVLFGWLWLIFAVLLFVTGVPLDAVVCSVVQDPNYAIVDELIETRNKLGPHPGKTWLAEYVLPIPTSEATIGSIFKDCRDDKTLFKAVQLDKHPLANFTALIQFFDKLNVSSLISSINVAVGRINLLSGTVNRYLNVVTAVGNQIPLADLRQINSTINDRKREAEDYYDSLPPDAKESIKSQVNQQFRTIEQLQREISSDVRRLDENLGNITSKINSTRQKAQSADRKIPGLAVTALQKGAEIFQKRVSKIIKSFIKESQDNVFEDYGKCGPLYNIAKSLLNKGLCGNVANLLNGGWLAIYWLHVFMLAAIVASIYFNRLIPRPMPKESSMRFEPSEEYLQANSTGTLSKSTIVTAQLPGADTAIPPFHPQDQFEELASRTNPDGIREVMLDNWKTGKEEHLARPTLMNDQVAVPARLMSTRDQATSPVVRSPSPNSLAESVSISTMESSSTVHI